MAVLWSSRGYVYDAVGSWRVFSVEVVRYSEPCVEKSRRAVAWVEGVGVVFSGCHAGGGSRFETCVESECLPRVAAEKFR